MKEDNDSEIVWRIENSDSSLHGEEGLEWDEPFSTKFIKAREDALKKYVMDEDVIASDNFGLQFGANAKAVRAVFWYIFESFMDPDLPSVFDVSMFSNKPLLQSTYAEVLRLRVATTMTRTNEKTDFKLGPDYTVPDNMTMPIFLSITAYSKQSWGTARLESLS